MFLIIIILTQHFKVKFNIFHGLILCLASILAKPSGLYQNKFFTELIRLKCLNVNYQYKPVRKICMKDKLVFNYRR